MKIDNLVIELERKHSNGRFIHPIREYGYTIIDYVKIYLKINRRDSLFIAHEYLKTLNKRIETNYSLRIIDELKDCNLLNEIEIFDN